MRAPLREAVRQERGIALAYEALADALSVDEELAAIQEHARAQDARGLQLRSTRREWLNPVVSALFDELLLREPVAQALEEYEGLAPGELELALELARSWKLASPMIVDRRAWAVVDPDGEGVGDPLLALAWARAESQAHRARIAPPPPPSAGGGGGAYSGYRSQKLRAGGVRRGDQHQDRHHGRPLRRALRAL